MQTDLQGFGSETRELSVGLVTKPRQPYRSISGRARDGELLVNLSIAHGTKQTPVGTKWGTLTEPLATGELLAVFNIAERLCDEFDIR